MANEKPTDPDLSRSREAHQLRLLVDATTDYAIFLLDSDGRIATWNPGAERLKGYSAEEIIGQHFSRFYPQDAIDRGWPAHELKVARAEGRFEDEGWRIRKDGSRFWANVVITALHDESGAFCGFGKITRDLTERKKSEEEAIRFAEEAASHRALEERVRLVQTQREQLQITLASIGDGVIATDLDANVTFMNSIAANLTGWSESEALSRRLEDVFNIVNESTRAKVANPALRALRDGTIVGLANHTQLISKDGTERAIADSAAPIRDDKNVVTGSVLVFRDVSKERQLELQRNVRLSAIQLLNSASTIEDAARGLLQNICENLGWEVGFYWAVDEKGACLACQQSCHREGAAVEDFEAASCSRRFTKGEGLPGRIWESGQCAWIIDITSDRNFPRFESAMKYGLRSAFGCPIVIGEQFLGIIEFFSKKLEQTDNDLLEMMQTVAGSFGQFIERKSAEQQLRESEQELSDFFENATVGLHWVGPDGTILRANRAELELLGYSRDEYVGHNIVDFHADGEVIDDILCRLKAKESLHGYEARLRCKDGSIKHVLISSNVLWNDGRFVHTRCFTRDITDRKRAEDALRRSEAQLSSELEATSRLHALSTRLLSADNLQAALEDILQDAILASQADFGNVQLYDRSSNALEIVAQSGFSREFLDHFRLVRIDEGSCCAQAMELGEPVVIEDVNLDPTYEPHRGIAAAAGYQAVQSTPIKSRSGQIIGMLSTHFRKPHRPSERDLRFVELHARHVADLIERSEMETALRHSAEQFRELADTMPQIVWTARPDGEIEYLNRRWTEFTGLPTTVGTNGWQQILHRADADPAAKRWAECMKTGSSFEMEMRLFDCREQAYRWHLIRTVAIRDEAGNISRWFGTSTDIHDQKRAEETSRYLAEASAALAGVVDYESTLQKVANLAVPYFADWSAVDVLDGDNLRRLAVSHQDSSRLELVNELSRRYPVNLEEDEGVATVLRTGKPQIVSEITDEMIVAAAKDEKHLELVRSLGLKSYICVPLIVSGQSFGVLTFATAESSRKYSEADLAMAVDLANRASVAVENTRLYEALRDNDRRKDEFLATLAHELRNPLAPIRNSLQILKMPRVDEETVRRSLDMMERQLQHLVRLVDDLLDVSRVMRGKIELRKERIELAAIVARAVETAQPLIDAHHHHLTVDLSSDSLLIDADPVRLAQVIGNLLTNAAKYTEPNGRIWLTAGYENDSTVLTIRDSGIGIDPEMLPRIFQLFVQLDEGTNRAYGGLGIGLTLVKNLVEMHNGTVEARSKGKGKGSEFIVRLPRIHAGASPDVAPTEVPATPDTAASGTRLLVVDDNKDAATSLAMLLRLQGHDVQLAFSGVAALEMAKIFRPHLVFLDIGMPDMDGYEVARRLRNESWGRESILVALTGWGQHDDRRRSAEAGFNHHLVKPPELDSLTEILTELKTNGRLV